MLKEYQHEIEILESAIKKLLFVVAEHLPNNLSDKCVEPSDLEEELRSIRKLLQQTQTFKSNWEN